MVRESEVVIIAFRLGDSESSEDSRSSSFCRSCRNLLKVYRECRISSSRSPCTWRSTVIRIIEGKMKVIARTIAPSDKRSIARIRHEPIVKGTPSPGLSLPRSIHLVYLWSL